MAVRNRKFVYAWLIHVRLRVYICQWCVWGRCRRRHTKSFKKKLEISTQQAFSGWEAHKDRRKKNPRHNISPHQFPRNGKKRSQGLCHIQIGGQSMELGEFICAKSKKRGLYFESERKTSCITISPCLYACFSHKTHAKKEHKERKKTT